LGVLLNKSFLLEKC